MIYDSYDAAVKHYHYLNQQYPGMYEVAEYAD